MSSQETNVSFQEVVSVDTTSNTACIDVASSSQSLTLASTQTSSLNVEGRENNISRELSERLFRCAEFDWKSTNAMGTLLKTINIPDDIIDAAMRVPNGAILMPYVYGHFDSYLKFMINCNRFQVGQLQISWNYCLDGVQEYCFNSIYLSSQRPHGIYSASANNTVELYIPFKYIYPYVCLRKFDNNVRLPNMATVEIRVLSPLLVNEATYDRIRGTVLFAFKNFIGHGMVPLEIARHEMLSIGVAGVEGMIRKAKQVYNLDNPSNPCVKSTFVPYASHSWANGNNIVEELNILRLDPLAIIPHPNENRYEMRISNIIRTYGLIHTTQWRMNQTSGSVIWWKAVTPIGDYKKLPIFSPQNSSNRYLELRNVPPISIISSLFANWRGSIEIRVDVIRTMMHTGRLILSYLPLAQKGSIKNLRGNWMPPTIDMLYGGYYVLMDLGGDENSFSFNIPFISNRPWLSTVSNNRFELDERSCSHGCVFLAIVNGLVPMQSVPEYVNINIYMRAGFDFELSVPCKPLLGTAFNKEFSYKFDSIRFILASPNYLTKWMPYGSGKYYIFKYPNETVPREVEGKILYNTYYYLSAEFRGPNIPIRDEKTGNISLKEARYFFIPHRPMDEAFKGKNFLIPCFTEEQAKECVDKVNSKHQFCGIPYIKDVDDFWHINAFFLPKPVLDFNHEMDERKTDSLQQKFDNITSTVDDMSFYNENFKDLKNYCRRYQLYAETTIKLTQEYGFGAVVLLIPLYPGGLGFDTNNVGHLINDSLNYTREGVIPIIASGFRYFRGGLRFKLIITSKDGKDIVFSITHMPDVFLPPSLKTIPPKGMNKDYVSSGYACYNQSTRINEIFEIEVPYYLQSDFGLLNPRENMNLEAMKFSSLGCLAVAVMSRIDIDHDFAIQVYYSIADDMNFSEFQGFPAMCNALTVPGYSLKEDDDSDIFDIIEHEMFSSLKQKVIDTTIGDEQVGKAMAANAQPTIDKVSTVINEQGNKLIDKFSDNMSKLLEPNIIKLGDTIKNEGNSLIDTFGARFDSSISTLCDYLTTTLEQVLGKVMDVTTNIIKNAVAQIIHVFVSPTPATIVTCIIGFLVSIGALATNLMSRLLTLMRRVYLPILNRMMRRTENHDINQQGNVSGEHEFDLDLNDSETCALTATAITVIAAGFGLKNISGRHGLNFFRDVMVGIKDFSFCANSLTIFIRNNISCFSKVIQYISRKVSRQHCITEDILDCNVKITEWAKSVKVLTNPLLREQINSNPRLQYQVFIRDIEGQALTLRNDISDVPLQEIRQLSTKIRQLQEELVNDKLCPAARQEPYVIQFFGESNIGKSFLVGETVISMLKSINYKTFADPIFVRTPGTAYWNGVNKQPCVWMDDVFCVTSGEVAQEQMREIFSLKSSCTFNPPIAEIENKKLRYNPKIVVLTSNEAFWNLIGLSEPKALYRRRDALWEVKKRSVYQDQSPRDIDPKITKDFGHLLFRKSNDASNRDALMGEWMEYSKFLETVCADFKKYDTQEMINYRNRIQNLTRLFPIEPEVPLANLFESSEDLLKQCSENINNLTQITSIDEFKKSIQPMCNLSYRTAYGEQEMEDEQACINFMFDRPTPIIQANHEAKHNDKKKNSEKEPLVVASTSKDNYGAFHYETTIADPVYGGIDRNSNEYCMVCMCEGNRNSTLMCNECPLSTRQCLKYYTDFRLYLEANPNRHKECAHVYLDGNYVSDEFPEDDGCYYLHNTEPRSNKPEKINEAICQNDCILSVEGDASPIVFKFLLALFQQNYGHPVQVLNNRDETIRIPDFYLKWLIILRHPANGIACQRKYEQVEAEYRDYQIRSLGRMGYYRQRFNAFVAENPIRQVWHHFKKVLKWLGIVAAGSALMYGAWRLTSSTSEADNHNMTTTTTSTTTTTNGWDPPKPIKFIDQKPELHQSGTISTRGSKPNKMDRQRSLKESVKRLTFIQPEASTYNSQSVIDDMLDLFSRNMAYLCYYDKDGNEIFRQRLLGLAYNYALTTKHFIESVEYMKKDDPKGKVIIRRGAQRFTFNWSDFKPIVHEHSSYALVQINGNLTFRNIIKHIATNNEHSIMNPDALFVDYTENRIHTKQVYLDIATNLKISGAKTCSPQNLDTVYSYNHHGNGLCGSPIISMKPVPKIVGIHVAGSQSLNKGYAQPILQEYFSELKFKEVAELPVDHQMRENKPMFELENNVLVLGTIPKHLAVHIPSKSKIIPSPMYGQICDVETEPAPLSLNDARISDHKRSPMVEGTAKHGLTPLPFDHKILDECQRDLSEVIQRCRPVMLGKSRELLNDQEIFGGVIGNESFGKIELGSSEGYPLILNRPKNANSKKWLFDYVDNQNENGLTLNKIDPMLKDLIDYNMNIRKQGRVPNQVFFNCLKDSRIVKEKVKIPGKTRVFSVCPIEYTWCMKKYFGQFQAAYSSARFNSETAIGINTNSSEWTMLYNYLLKLSNNIIVGDYKAFGDRLYWYCIHLAFKTIREWYAFHYGSYNNSIREIMELELRYSTRLVGNVAYRTMCGIPSGFPLTVEVNNMVNQLYMRYVFKVTTNLPMAYFNRYTKLVCYGDDLIMSVDDKILDKFNFKTIQTTLQELNIEFTPADKSDSNPICWSIDQVTFLKSYFRPHPFRPGVVISQLPLSSCVDELHWMWTSNDEVLTCYESARGCLNNLYGHGPDVFNYYRKKILEWFCKQDRDKYDIPHLVSWDDIDKRNFGEG